MIDGGRIAVLLVIRLRRLTNVIIFKKAFRTGFLGPQSRSLLFVHSTWIKINRSRFLRLTKIGRDASLKKGEDDKQRE